MVGSFYCIVQHIKRVPSEILHIHVYIQYYMCMYMHYDAYAYPNIVVLYIYIYAHNYIFIGAGIVTSSKAMIAESSDDSNQAFGLSIIGSAWGVGLILGPALSGATADPIGQYDLNITSEYNSVWGGGGGEDGRGAEERRVGWGRVWAV